MVIGCQKLLEYLFAVCCDDVIVDKIHNINSCLVVKGKSQSQPNTNNVSRTSAQVQRWVSLVTLYLPLSTTGGN